MPVRHCRTRTKNSSRDEQEILEKLTRSTKIIILVTLACLDIAGGTDRLGRFYPAQEMIEIRHKQSGAVLARVEGNTLHSAMLADAQLAGADLTGADLSHAVLRGANLQEASLDNASLVGTCLDRANLQNVSALGANLSEASLRQAKLTGAKLDGSQLRFARLAGAKFVKASLVEANLAMAEAPNADFSEANLGMADLRGGNFLEANFGRAKLTGANLTGATLPSALAKSTSHQAAKGQQGSSTREELLDDDLVAKSVSRAGSAAADPNRAKPLILPVTCPDCDGRLKLPRDKLDGYINCPHCQERFFVDRSGTAHLKKPVQETDWTPEVGTAGASRTDWELPGKWNDRFGLTLVVGLSFLTVGLLAVIAMAWWNRLPSDLKGRALSAGWAFTSGDDEVLRRLAGEEMEDSTVRWFGNLRSPEWDRRIAAGDDIRVQAKVLSEDRKSKSAVVALNVSLVGASGNADNRPLEVPMEIGWLLDRDGAWRINSNNLRAVPSTPAPTPLVPDG
jgi:uncharacterized protein YjbI with pentapeptide repeats